MNEHKYIQAKNLKLVMGHPHPIVGFDRELKVTQWNPAAEKVFGYSAIEALGNNLLDYVSPKDKLSKDLRFFGGILTSGKESSQDVAIRYNKAGDIIMISTDLLPIIDSNGEVVSGVAIFEDHTEEYFEKKRLEESLAVMKSGGFELVNGSSLELHSSAQMIRLLLLDKDEQADFGLFLGVFEQEDSKALKKALQMTLGSGSPDSLMCRLKNKSQDPDASVTYIRFAWHAESKKGKVLRIFGTVSDISDQVEQTRQEEARRVDLVGKSRTAAISELAAGVAHEINNPLAIITGLIKTIPARLNKQPVDTEALQKHLAKITNASGRIVKVVSSLRKFANESEGDSTEEVNIAELVEETVSFCKERVESHNIYLNVMKIPEHVLLDCRPREISQALLNLINNAHDAIRFTAGDNWIRIEGAETSDDKFELSVTDSGSGIPIEIRSKVWEPFFTTKRVGQGTGLGLSLSRGIIRQHGGEIFLDRSCKNTRFVIRLPMGQQAKKSA